MKKLLLFFCAALCACLAEAQITVAPFLTSNPQFSDNNGAPLNAGCVFSYAAGTSNPQATFTDSTGTVQNANPIITTSAGYATSGGIWLSSSAYKFVGKTSGGVNCATGTQLWSIDNITWSTPFSTFNGITDAGVFNITQPTAATSGANQSSFTDCIHGTYWTGAASADDKWCWQDVLGTGSNPTTTYTLTHTGSPGTAAISLPSVTVGGPVTAQSLSGNPQVNGTNFATIDAALTSSFCTSANGCHIFIAPGTYACPTTTITTGPTIIEGSGSGEYNTNFTTYVAPTILSMTSQTANCINAALPASNIMDKFTIRHLMIAGNKNVAGASAGDGIVLTGGTVAGGMRNVQIEDVTVQQTFGNGLDIKENTFLVHVINSSFLHNGGHGIAITDVTANPGATQIYFDHITLESNGLDGLNINGAHIQDINCVRCTLATNTNNGVNIVAGSSSARFQAELSNFEGNGNAGVLIKDSGGHVINTSTFPSDSIQLYGIFLDPPGGAGFGATQLSLEGNNLAGGNLTKDVNVTANAHVCFIGVQALNSAVYTFSDTNHACARIDANSGGLGLDLQVDGLYSITAGATALGLTTNPFSKVIVGTNSGSVAVTHNGPGANFVATLPNNTGTLAELNLAQNWIPTQTFTNPPVPNAAGNPDFGTTALPWGNIWFGTAATNNFKLQPAATTGARVITVADPLQATVGLPMTIANGTKALNTNAVTTATCDGGVAATATGTLATDTVDWSFNAAPTATNKYGAFLVVYAVPSANTVTFYTCNPSATTSTPTAMTVNWSVRRP